MPCRAVQCNAVQCNAVQCSAVQCSAVKWSTLQCSTVLISCGRVFMSFLWLDLLPLAASRQLVLTLYTALNSTLSSVQCKVLYCILIYSTLLHSIILHSTLLYYVALYSTALYYTTLNSTALYSTALYYTLLDCIYCTIFRLCYTILSLYSTRLQDYFAVLLLISNFSSLDCSVLLWILIGSCVTQISDL